MGKGRLEAFSDGVLAIIITIMVLEMKVPHGDSVHDLLPLLPVFFSYILSFVYVGIYWNNHLRWGDKKIIIILLNLSSCLTHGGLGCYSPIMEEQ
jgi:uncharacterized membrane protein